MQARAVGIVSGGLDSLLATKLILDQGIEVDALHFEILFSEKYQKEPEKYKAMRNFARQMGFNIHFMDIVDEYLENVLKKPKFGYGKNMNPCLDCHIYMLKKAGVFMKKNECDFIYTGEVLGQRPMTQMREKLQLINEETGLGDYLLRPLSAKMLEPTAPERNGLIDRDRLEGIEGRTRTRQIALAEELGIYGYPSPAGGCLYTDRNFSCKLKDLLDHDPDFSSRELYFLKYGRHFRTDNCRIIVGRDYDENNALEESCEGLWLVSPSEVTGPSAVIIKDSSSCDPVSQKNIKTACDLVARYSNKDTISIRIVSPDGTESVTSGTPIDESRLEKLRIEVV